MARWLTVLLVFFLATGTAAAQNKVKISSELDEPETIVGQPLTLRVKILVPTWMTKGAEFPNLEVPGVMVRLPERSGGPVTETIDGETWSGVQRGYRIFPLETGTFDVPDQTLTITYAEPGSSEPVEEKVQFEGASFKAVLPEAAKQLDPPIIAKSFSLEQSVEGETEVATGDAITRTLTAKIDGTTPVLIPALTPGSDDQLLRAYTSEPNVTESENRGVLSGSRVEKTTYVAQSAGPTNIPAVEFSWFNIETCKTGNVSVPEIAITIAESAGVPSQGVDVRNITEWVVWFVVGAILAAIAYRYLYPPIMEKLEDRRRARLASEQFAHQQVIHAIKSKDLNSVSIAVDKWLAFYPGDSKTLRTELATGMANLGVFEFGYDPKGIESANWEAFHNKYRRLRKQIIRKNSGNSALRSLPELNPDWNSRS